MSRRRKNLIEFDTVLQQLTSAPSGKRDRGGPPPIAPTLYARLTGSPILHRLDLVSECGDAFSQTLKARQMRPLATCFLCVLPRDYAERLRSMRKLSDAELNRKYPSGEIVATADQETAARENRVMIAEKKREAKERKEKMRAEIAAEKAAELAKVKAAKLKAKREAARAAKPRSPRADYWRDWYRRRRAKAKALAAAESRV